MSECGVCESGACEIFVPTQSSGDLLQCHNPQAITPMLSQIRHLFQDECNLTRNTGVYLSDGKQHNIEDHDELDGR